ncbi:hypothetical protein K466DRAFT_596761 [Polyporus arcularius HHB13444]|uniref:Uncharacterized protein n=1 Tax=Polyporus arcularius HHB13444 TaxID=1314778 RepID=A0A5C3PX95_9APHY|nr:hypothetical protein K466DRAFT_596761 [Polyporus arcularius HHB13444]
MSQQCKQCQCPDYRIPPEFPATFTASQLARALLLVVSEDLTVNPDQDTRKYLCINCMQRGLRGERLMTFGVPDSDPQEEHNLVRQLREIMYPHGVPHVAARAAVPVDESLEGSVYDDAGEGGSRKSGVDEYRNTWNIVGPAPEATTRTGTPFIDLNTTSSSSGALRTPATPTVQPAEPVQLAPHVPHAQPALPAQPDLPDLPAAPTVAGPFSPDWNPQRPYIAPDSRSTNWHVVTVGYRVGVFDNMDSAVVSCPGNSSSVQRNRNAAIESFVTAQSVPGRVRVVPRAIGF